jgi:hypothetical protein
MTIGAEETWTVSFGGVYRKVRVVKAGETPGFWECIDLETGIIFTARERWFIERADDERAG